MHSKLSKLKTVAAQQAGLILFALNFFGAVLYLLGASHGWVIPQERELGLHSVTGEPYIWAIYVFPIWALFLLLNLVWVAIVLKRQHWRSGLLWLMTIPIWLVAMAIDFAHH